MIATTNPSISPPEFYDPITYDIMVDPVVCSDGRTYDRSLAAKLAKSPFDRTPLTILVENKDLRTRIYAAHPDVARAAALRNLQLKRPHIPEYRQRRLAWRPLQGYGHGFFSDGSYFRGEFRDGKPHGYGDWVMPSGERRVGHFANGWLHGSGIHYRADGTDYVGLFHHGRPRALDNMASRLKPALSRLPSISDSPQGSIGAANMNRGQAASSCHLVRSRAANLPLLPPTSPIPSHAR